MTTGQIHELRGKSHLDIIRRHAAQHSFIEIRALKRQPRTAASEAMKWAGNAFIAVEASEDELRTTLQWAEKLTRHGAEIFVGYNARFRKGRSKADVKRMTACYTDLDLHGNDRSSALKAASACPSQPHLIVNSGYGLHLVWFIRPTEDKNRWQRVQRGIENYFSEHGSDRAVSTDESRLLRLVPFPNLKNGDKKPTEILGQSADTEPHDIADLEHAFKQMLAGHVMENPYQAPQEIPQGQRNTFLTKLAGSMRRFGAAKETIVHCF